jgi:hypothetical protein
MSPSINFRWGRLFKEFTGESKQRQRQQLLREETHAHSEVCLGARGECSPTRAFQPLDTAMQKTASVASGAASKKITELWQNAC